MLPQLRLSYGERQLREKFEYFQIQKHHSQIRPVSCSSYATIAPRPPLSYGSLNIVLEYLALPRRLPYAPFHILPFPYLERLCIMNPYPPHQQEHTPS